MNGFRHQLFARPAFSRNQDIRLVEPLLQQVIEGTHFGALSNDILKMISVSDHLFQQNILFLKFFFPKRF